MVDYEKMYRVLFYSITDAIVNIDMQNFGTARDDLIKAQRNVEDIYADAED